jgi:tetratricopeptide (TPR) repeat protein
MEDSRLRAPRIAVLAACWLLGAGCAANDSSEPPASATRDAASAAPTQPAAPTAPNEQQTRERMAEIFAAMRFLLPLSLDEQAFEDPAHSQGIRNALALLDESAASLAQHGASREVPFSHLARSLAIDARDIHERYDQGHVREARYLVQTLAETCVACHSRLPAASDAPRSEAFLADASVEKLPNVQRAKLAYATRQFDEALTLYETVLADPSFPANDIDLEGHLDDYLELAIRVRGEPARALAALKRFTRRKDLSPTLRGEVQHWIASLERLATRGPVAAPVDEARAAIDRAEAGQPDVDERDALVELLDASALLHRFLADGRPPHAEQAEAYYLLGVIETRIGRSFWLSQAEAYLETAIRLAPGEPIAKDAYVLLEDFLVAGYSGSGGTFVPRDIREKLELLRKISEGEAPASS